MRIEARAEIGRPGSRRRSQRARQAAAPGWPKSVRASPGSGADGGAGLRFNSIAGMKPSGSGGEHDKDYRLEARRGRDCGLARRVGRVSSRFAQNRELAQRRRRHLEQTIIPAFNKHYPDIKIEFAPSAPKEYNAALNARLAGEPRATLSLAGPSTPRSISIASTRSTASTTSRAWPIFPMSRSRPGPPTTARRHSACRWPRSSTASSITRTPSTKSARPAEDDGGVPRGSR